jgi:hypothetical protein
MSYFILPQRWITPAIAAAAMALGPIDSQVSIRYHNWKGDTQAVAQKPGTIWVDKRRTWDKRQAQCVLVHYYGHLAGRPRSKDPIMRAPVSYKTCKRWLRRHRVR